MVATPKSRISFQREWLPLRLVVRCGEPLGRSLTMTA